MNGRVIIDNFYIIYPYQIMNRLSLLSQRITGTAHYTKINLYYNGNVGYISLRSPKDLNCLSVVMMSEIGQAIEAMGKDESVNVIVIISELAHIFCAGADIKEFSASYFDYEYSMRMEPFHQLPRVFEMNKKPIIAAVSGKALGGGFELALMCDFIVASEKASFGFPEINLGLMPGIGGTQRLSKIIGEKKAMRYILTGEGFKAE